MLYFILFYFIFFSFAFAFAVRFFSGIEEYGVMPWIVSFRFISSCPLWLGNVLCTGLLFSGVEVGCEGLVFIYFFIFFASLLLWAVGRTVVGFLNV